MAAAGIFWFAASTTHHNTQNSAEQRSTLQHSAAQHSASRLYLSVHWVSSRPAFAYWLAAVLLHASKPDPTSYQLLQPPLITARVSYLASRGYKPPRYKAVPRPILLSRRNINWISCLRRSNRIYTLLSSLILAIFGPAVSCVIGGTVAGSFYKAPAPAPAAPLLAHSTLPPYGVAY